MGANMATGETEFGETHSSKELRILISCTHYGGGILDVWYGPIPKLVGSVPLFLVSIGWRIA